MNLLKWNKKTTTNVDHSSTRFNLLITTNAHSFHSNLKLCLKFSSNFSISLHKKLRDRKRKKRETHPSRTIWILLALCLSCDTSYFRKGVKYKFVFGFRFTFHCHLYKIWNCRIGFFVTLTTWFVYEISAFFDSIFILYVSN